MALRINEIILIYLFHKRIEYCKVSGNMDILIIQSVSILVFSAAIATAHSSYHLQLLFLLTLLLILILPY